MKFGMLAMICGAAAGMSMLTGCETLSQTPAENGNTMVRAIDTNGKQIPEDTERLLLLDRPSWLSKKPVPSY